MKNCPNLQKSLDWCEGMPQLPGIRRRLYYTNKNLIVAWPELDRDDFGRVVDANYIGAFELAEGAYWQYIDVNIDKSTVTSEPQGEVPSQTQLNKATFVHNGIDDEATAAAGFLNNSDCVIVYEDMRGHFRVLGNNKWRTLITVSQDQGQGTNPASTTINVEVTDVIAPPFYAEGLETEAGEVFPSYDDDAALEPRLTSPSGNSFDIGTMAESATTISKQLYIKGENLTESLTLTKTGSALSLSKSTITAEEANAGINITLTYTKSSAGAGSLTGVLYISSSEVEKQITVTARKAALTSPSDASINIGTIASNGSSVQRQITIQGENLSKSLTLSVTGTGITISKQSISASQANAGIQVTLTYTNSAAGAASVTGSLVISSSEVSKTITLTASKEAEAATPAVTSPSADSINVGTIASGDTEVTKNVTIRGENITQPITLAVTGTGFSININSLTAAQMNFGYGVRITYTNSGSAAASASGSLVISSSEVSKTIELTAGKEAEVIQATEDIPQGLMGLVTDYNVAVNVGFNNQNTTDYIQSSKRQAIAVPVSENFPVIPAAHLHHTAGDEDSGSEPENSFVMNTAMQDYTLVEGKNIKSFLYRICSTDVVSHSSAGVLDPQNNHGSPKYMLITDFLWQWVQGKHQYDFKLHTLSQYAAQNKYYFVCNHKKVVSNSDQMMTAEMEYRKDFDMIIAPQTWNINNIFSEVYTSYFDNTQQHAGGFVMTSNYAIQFFTSGKVLVLDKTTHAVIAAGSMDGAANNMHCNAVSLGPTKPSGTEIPYVYISQWTSGYCICHVEEMTVNRSVECRRVQQISYSGSKFKTSLNWDWSVDAKTGYIWAIGYAASASDRYGAKVALKFALPNVNQGDVIFTDSDIVDEFAFTFAGAQQDIHIENGFAFWAFSYNNANYLGGILMIDLDGHKLFSDYIIDMQGLQREPQGVFREGSTLYLTTHLSEYDVYDLAMHTVNLLQTNLAEES